MVSCPYCSKPAVFVGGDVIYPHRPDLAEKRFWHCAPCDAYVGCHKDTDNPFGRLANKELRAARLNAHAAFDPIWRGTQRARTRTSGSPKCSALSRTPVTWVTSTSRCARASSRFCQSFGSRSPLRFHERRCPTRMWLSGTSKSKNNDSIHRTTTRRMMARMAIRIFASIGIRPIRYSATPMISSTMTRPMMLMTEAQANTRPNCGRCRLFKEVGKRL